MNPVLAGFLGLSVGLAAGVWAVPAAAQETGLPSTIVDLTERDLDSGRGRDGREVARGDDADSISYTIVENPDSGDATTEVAPAAPDLSRVPVMADSDETTMVPPSGEPASAPMDGAPPAGVAGDVTTADAAAGEAASPVAACADFATWYDAQVFYESMGGTAASSELITSLDPDADGFACEELVEYA